MKIYHGANFDKLDVILSCGLNPRGKKKSVWSNAPSHPNMVYLSTAYPFYFSMAAQSKKNFRKGLVFEIDMDMLDKKLLYPDEDFLWYALKMKNPTLKLEQIRKDLWRYQQNWQLCLDNFGNIAYMGRINPECFTRYCVVNFDIQKEVGLSVLDPTITPMNYKFKGQFYKDLVSWFFGDKKLLPHIEEEQKWKTLEGLPVPNSQEKIDFWTKISENREGIEVVEL